MCRKFESSPIEVEHMAGWSDDDSSVVEVCFVYEHLSVVPRLVFYFCSRETVDMLIKLVSTQLVIIAANSVCVLQRDVSETVKGIFLRLHE